MARKKCTTANKDRFPDQLEADLAIVGIQISNSHHRHRKFREEPQRSYQCSDCKGWHITSKPDRELLTR